MYMYIRPSFTKILFFLILILGESAEESSSYSEVRMSRQGFPDPTEEQTENAPISNTTDSIQRSHGVIQLNNQDTPSEPNKEEESFELDEETVKIIGEEPPKSQKELEIHSSLASRWNLWLQQGLKKEVRDELLMKHPRAGIYSLEPPILNQELSALNANILKKDRYFMFTQNLAGSALSALAPVITELVPMKTKESRKILESLWDVAQLVAEIHHSQTVARRACILPSVSKQMAEQLAKRKTDKYLFGENLGERIKEIKMISKIGQDIKIQPSKMSSNSQNPSNWKGPLGSQKSATQSGYKQRPQQSRKPTTSESTKKPYYPRSSRYRDQARYRDKPRYR